ncbi:hypothetical protein GCM10027280_43740 [Micromonospora polyrhachis]|uniref:Uncharacterized protein n=1 Tax=Micromonospora polyrhachis TaxID=1282883 RepID=A0A7W7WRJ7_9ACTN|nr:hypothetical protein [Micromonospora polyrhachis]MBB4961366.1 hypothetical protein [Micromonospora polyrhachis]
MSGLRPTAEGLTLLGSDGGERPRGLLRLLPSAIWSLIPSTSTTTTAESTFARARADGLLASRADAVARIQPRTIWSTAPHPTPLGRYAVADHLPDIDRWGAA